MPRFQPISQGEREEEIGKEVLILTDRNEYNWRNVVFLWTFLQLYTYPALKNKYYLEVVENEITMEELFG